MKVAGNKLAHLSDYYHSELDEVLGKDEVSAVFKLAAEHYLPIKRNEVHLRLNDHINQSELLDIYDCCKELKKGRPLQYILGEAWFYGMRFKVNENVLIPRPETEELCELIIRENKNCISLLDIGTGSGCIPITIKKHLPKCNVSALDISEEALVTAKLNAELSGTEIEFIKGDILQKKKIEERKIEVIVSNPPYIKKEESDSLSKQVLAHEPHLALFVEGDDDIIFYRNIIEVCKTMLAPKGKLYFELNPLTANKVLDHAKSSGIFKKAELRKDMSGNVRFLIAQA